MKKIKIINALFGILLNSYGLTQEVDIENKQRIILNSINKDFTAAYLTMDTNKISNYYNSESVIMPEFHRTLYGDDAILNYFQHWFDATGSGTSERSIYEIQFLDGYLLEIGIFSQIYNKTDVESLEYKGKYMRIWEIVNQKDMKIVSEIWGANDFIDRSKFPILKYAVSKINPTYKAEEKIIQEVKDRNRIIAGLVKNRNGKEHSTLFTDDAVYMPYYMPMLVGIDDIRLYFNDHEKPGDIIIDSIQINTGKIIDLGNFILENGYYRVRWNTKNYTNGEVVTGKSVNLWKRDENGTLKLYRQMVNHD